MSDVRKPTTNNNRIAYKYIGLTTQIMVALLVGVYIGYKIDHWLSFSAPVFVLLLPLLIIIAIIWQIIKDTSKK